MPPLTPGREDIFDNAASKVRYQAYARLQATAVAFGETLPIPEIVAIGGQSDGKSSLLEAFLGFRFNVCSSEMGTRRPLIVQMVHDPSAHEPLCRLQDEDGSAYGDILPPNAIADALRDRTESLLRSLGAPVSSKPIVMRAEYAYCPNLTIIDTPGFILQARKGEAESTPDNIKAMVKEQCEPRHRLILFLQQSSVEWASSLWMNVLQEVDPSFSRTVFVCSKFDNRLGEFSERWELEKYLSASGYLPSSVKPFFVSLPKDKSQETSADWRAAIQATDRKVKHRLKQEISGGYDEERFGSRIGFGNLRRYLEEELAARYRDAAPGTLALLQERCTAVTSKLAAAEERVRRAGDVTALRRAAIEHALSLAARVDSVMAGFGGAEPKRYGYTTDEERTASAMPWPGAAASHAAPPNANLRLFGGAAFERCLQEFRRAVQAVKLPETPRDTVANMLLAAHGRGDAAGAAARAAEELARSAARNALSALLNVAAARLAAIVQRAYDIAAELESSAIANTSTIVSVDALRPYVAFHTQLRASFHDFVVALEKRAIELLHHHLDTATGHFSAMALGENQLPGLLPTVNTLAPGMSCGPGEFGSPHDSAHDDQEEERVALDDGEDAAAAAAAGNENVRPITTTVQRPGAAARIAFIHTQMTVPETPSPDIPIEKVKQDMHGNPRRAFAAAGRNLDVSSPGKGRVAKAARLAGTSSVPYDDGKTPSGYAEVCSRAEALFNAIKHSLAAQTAPGTLKAAFLEPLQGRLAAELCVRTVGRTDADFLSLFATAGALEALKAERDALKRREEGLVRMTEEFGELARAL